MPASESRDGVTSLTKSHGYMSISCNASAPTEVPREVINALPPDLEIVELERRQKELFNNLGSLWVHQPRTRD
jgi:hypothetical protein